jgi:hypothetical protein
VVFEVGVVLRSWGRIPALGDNWELVDKRVYAWHEWVTAVSEDVIYAVVGSCADGIWPVELVGLRRR